MEERTWEANSPLANHEIPCPSGTQKFCYHIHKDQPLVPILSNINPFHGLIFCKNCFNIILLPASRSAFRFSRPFCPFLRPSSYIKTFFFKLLLTQISVESCSPPSSVHILSLPLHSPTLHSLMFVWPCITDTII